MNEDEFNEDQALRMIALEHAVSVAKYRSSASEVVNDAEAFYNFLKGNENENVQTANH